jgi:hypothetical protein
VYSEVLNRLAIVNIGEGGVRRSALEVFLELILQCLNLQLTSKLFNLTLSYVVVNVIKYYNILLLY